MFKSLYEVKEHILKLVEKTPQILGPGLEIAYIDAIYQDLIKGKELPKLPEGKKLGKFTIKAMCYDALASLVSVGVLATPENCSKLYNWFVRDLQ